MTTILITGCDGQLANALKDTIKTSIQPTPLNCIFTNHKQFDITNYTQCLNFIKNNSSPILYIVNCAAYTNVDKAETDKYNAHNINSIGPQHLAKLAQQFKIKLIHISTDYVFPEYKNSKAPYTEQDLTNPVNYYGMTKLYGENNIINILDNYIIIRAGWLYYHYGKNFFNTIYNLAKLKDNLNIVADQYGTPTYCGDFSDFIFHIIKQDLNNPTNNYFGNIYNFSNLGQCSWFDFASEIIKQANLNCKVVSITSQQYPTTAKRPKLSVLDKTKAIDTFGCKIPSWQDGLARCLSEINMNTKAHVAS